MTPEMRRRLAKAILTYMETKPVDEPARSWQDFILVMCSTIYSLKRLSSYAKHSSERPRTQAAFYAHFAQLSETLRATTEEIEEIHQALKRGKPVYDSVKMTDVAEELANCAR
jgi:hypothetical protein